MKYAVTIVHYQLYVATRERETTSQHRQVVGESVWYNYRNNMDENRSGRNGVEIGKTGG